MATFYCSLSKAQFLSPGTGGIRQPGHASSISTHRTIQTHERRGGFFAIVYEWILYELTRLEPLVIKDLINRCRCMHKISTYSKIQTHLSL